ncbi:MAG: carboxymuconolactone decarboxylase family protein [Pseudomonadota bacterium]
MTGELLPPLTDAELDCSDRERVAAATAFMGFDANDVRAMARVPGLVAAMAALIDSCYRPGRVPLELKRLMAYVSSRGAASSYCEAHTLHGAQRAGVDPARIAAASNFEESNLFTAADKAALRLAYGAGTGAINGLAELRQYFDADETAELLAVLSLFGFLNRWNRLAETTLEQAPRAAAESARKTTHTTSPETDDVARTG